LAPYMPSLYATIQNQPVAAGDAQRPRLKPSGQFQDLLALKQGRAFDGNKGSKSGIGQDRSLIHLGRLSQESPTVSHLLINHPEYSSECWSIVHNPINQGKPFRHLLPDQDVWLDPATKEVVLDHRQNPVPPGKEESMFSVVLKQPESTTNVPEIVQEIKPAASNAGGREYPVPSSILAPAFSFTSPTLEQRGHHVAFSQSLPQASLSQAVAAYRGQPYSSMDCYELVVQGLKDLGVQYSGQQGLQHALIREAKANNLPLNALLTGEGLTSSLGRTIAELQVTPENNGASQQAEQVLASIQNRLEPGMILSFSTMNRGHTGVISVHHGQWTFINSGQIDNSVHPGENGRQVGEERLDQELTNWIQRAGRENSELQITVGRLEQEKLASYQSPSNRRA